jgi:hypothetical protein
LHVLLLEEAAEVVRPAAADADAANRDSFGMTSGAATAAVEAAAVLKKPRRSSLKVCLVVFID